MNSKEWLLVEESELYLKNINYRDLNDCDCDWDSVRCVVWVKRNSPTATMLALKGCEFNRPNPHLL